MMRDDDLDTPIPPEFQPSSYNRDSEATARRELETLQAMDSAAKIAYGEDLRQKTIERFQRNLDEQAAQNKRLADMKDQVEAWIPPTPDHVEMKQFMLQQIEVSKSCSDYVEASLQKARTESPMDFYAAAVRDLERSITYHSQAQKEEEERTRGRSEWVKQLRASLPS